MRKQDHAWYVWQVSSCNLARELPLEELLKLQQLICKKLNIKPEDFLDFDKCKFFFSDMDGDKAHFDKDYKIPKNLIKICLPSKETKKHSIGELISVELGDTRKNALLIDFDRSSRKANLLATSLLLMTTWLKEAKERKIIAARAIPMLAHLGRKWKQTPDTKDGEGEPTT